jgi:hypothetical protein
MWATLGVPGEHTFWMRRLHRDVRGDKERPRKCVPITAAGAHRGDDHNCAAIVCAHPRAGGNVRCGWDTMHAQQNGKSSSASARWRRQSQSRFVAACVAASATFDAALRWRRPFLKPSGSWLRHTNQACVRRGPTSRDRSPFALPRLATVIARSRQAAYGVRR